MVDPGLHIMVVAEPASGTFLDWQRVLSRAAEQGGIVSLLEVRGTGAKWLIPAAPVAATAFSIPVGAASGRAAVGSGIAVIDKIFEAQALVPAIRATEVWLFAGQTVEAELADSLASEATIQLRVFEKGELRGGIVASGATGGSGLVTQASTSAPTGRSLAVDMTPRARSSRLGLVAASVMLLALGFGAGWAVFGSGTPQGSNDGTGSASSNASSAPEEVSSVPTVTFKPGQCTDVPGYVLLHDDSVDLAARVVDCDAATALTKIVSPDEKCEYCQTAKDINGQSVEFLEIPRVGQCFFAYLLASGRGTGWPTIYAPCYSEPSPWIRGRESDIATKLEVDSSDLKLTTLVIRKMSTTETKCDDGQHQWEISTGASSKWICAQELMTHE